MKLLRILVSDPELVNRQAAQAQLKNCHLMIVPKIEVARKVLMGGGVNVLLTNTPFLANQAVESGVSLIGIIGNCYNPNGQAQENAPLDQMKKVGESEILISVSGHKWTDQFCSHDLATPTSNEPSIRAKNWARVLEELQSS